MEKQISELNEEEIVGLIYDRVEAFWGKFPNVWNYITKDEVAVEAALDLYRARKSDGVPFIVYYNSTKGDRSLKPMIGMVVYNVYRAFARNIHSTGIRNVPERKALYSALSLEAPILKSDDGDVILADIVADEKVNVGKDIDFISLFENLPDKEVKNVFYCLGGNYYQVSYKSILKDIMDGYSLSQISEILVKKDKRGVYSSYAGLHRLVRKMRADMQSYLDKEYGLTKDNYVNGWRAL